MSQPRDALETIRFHLNKALGDDDESKIELRLAFDELAEWCESMNAAKSAANRAANVASCLANGIQPD